MRNNYRLTQIKGHSIKQLILENVLQQESTTVKAYQMKPFINPLSVLGSLCIGLDKMLSAISWNAKLTLSVGTLTT